MDNLISRWKCYAKQKSIINHRRKNTLISLCNLELAFKAKAKSSALENYRKKNAKQLNRLQKVNLSCAAITHTINKIEQKTRPQAELFLTHY